MPKIALTGTTGNLGSRVLRDLLKQNLIPPSDLIIVSSSAPEKVILISYPARKTLSCWYITYQSPIKESRITAIPKTIDSANCSQSFRRDSPWGLY